MMETQEEGGSTSLHGGQDTAPQGSSVGHRPRLVDEECALCDTDQQEGQEVRL